MTFYDKFLMLCEQHELSKQKACQLSGLSANAWIRWSTGSVPGASSMHKLCNYFAVTTDSMIDDDKMPEPVRDEGWEARQKILESIEMRALFDAAKDVPAHKLYEVISQLYRWKEENVERN